MASFPIESALILADGRVFNRPGAPAPAHALTTVGGLSLFQRTILTLQRGGISRFIVLAGPEAEALKRQTQGDARVTSEVRWLPVAEFPPGDLRSWEVLAGMFGGPYLVAGTSAVFPASLVARLREEGGTGEPVVVARNTEVPPSVLQQAQHERLTEGASHTTPVTLSQSKGEGGGGGGPMVTVEEATAPALDVDLVAIPATFTGSGWADVQDGPYPVQAAFERGIRKGQVRILPLGGALPLGGDLSLGGDQSLGEALRGASHGAFHGDWYQDVCTEGEATPEQAEWTLLQSLKGGLEGFVDRHFNRKCSKWITSVLLETPLTPNGVTVLAATVGLLAGAVLAMGGYAAGVVGALLFQLSAILDCCDGEVARMKFMESPFGEQLDVMLDNLVHVGLYSGMAWAAYHSDMAGWDLAGPVLGWLAIAGNVAAFVVVQRAIIMRDGLEAPRRRRVEAILNRLVSRDFSVLILALALIGHIEWFLVLAAVGSNIFWPLLAWQLRPAASSQ